MKNIILSSLALMLLTLTACDKNDDNNTNSITPELVKTTLQQGTWKVTYYFDTDHEETSNFTGYQFAFSDNGRVSAYNDVLTIPGTWSTMTEDGQTKVQITFNSPAEFEELTEDWQVLERSDTRVKLQHVSGGNGGTDYLTFEKN